MNEMNEEETEMDDRIQRLQLLRVEMKKKNIDYYIIPTSDFHNSEYVGDYFKIREWYSGFTGSNGTLLIAEDFAGLWTDGRYFVQAEKELKGSGIELFRLGEEGVPTIPEYIFKTGKKGVRIGFDGRILRKFYVDRMVNCCQELEPVLVCEEDIAGKLWEERPELSKEEIFVLPAEYRGRSIEEKASLVREKMKEEHADFLFVSKLDDIMWFYNIRGNDVECNPVALSYLVLTMDRMYLFVQKEALSPLAAEYLAANRVHIGEYADVFVFLEKEMAGFSGIADAEETSYLTTSIIERTGHILPATNPIEKIKAVKTPEEIEQMRRFYLEDSAAVCKFIYHIKKHGVGMTEYEAAEYLDNLRAGIEDFKGLSFPTISAYGANAAMMHYEAKKDNCASVENKGFLLVDSGGQYLGATTDVTRTIAMGELTEQEKKYFTLVAAGMLRLQNAVFLSGCTGRNLDILARQPLWELGIDYKCGTGHGVGFFLNVHEGPHSIRWKYVKDIVETVLEEGMVVTDEPGVYLANEMGIRTENVLLVKKKEQNTDGTFLTFEPLTFVPIDLEAVEAAYLEPSDIHKLNEYHALVFEKISPYLEGEEREWLRKVTRAI